MKLGGLLILAGIAWFFIWEWARWHFRSDGGRFPTAFSFSAGFIGPIGCIVICATAIVLLLLFTLSW
jgi:hypothetical protein